jgi:hypothetical protein
MLCACIRITALSSLLFFVCLHTIAAALRLFCCAGCA